MITDGGRGPGYGNRVRKYLQPVFAVPYGAALAIFVVAVIFFGWFGFWLGVAVLALVKVGRWAVPLIKLSYRQEPSAAPVDAPIEFSDDGSVDASR